MSLQKDWKTYFTADEVKEKLRVSVRAKAGKVVEEIKREVSINEATHV
jgi:hypothetical protein